MSFVGLGVLVTCVVAVFRSRLVEFQRDKFRVVSFFFFGLMILCVSCFSGVVIGFGLVRYWLGFAVLV